MDSVKCRFCSATLDHVFCDLGVHPLSNSFFQPKDSNKMLPFFPLKAMVCKKCFLVQLEELESPDNIFSDYLYFSSFSTSWLEHSRQYADQISQRLGLNSSHQVIELASNDGYLLKFFKEKGIRILGIEPAANVAKSAEAIGIPTLVKFFGVQTAKELVDKNCQADLLIGNNVLAHVPDINDFVAGIKILLKPQGVLTMEFPHLLQLIKNNQFDTIYHEHYSYLSLGTTKRIFESHGLRLFDVDELPTHGGSLRVYATHIENPRRETSAAVETLLKTESDFGLNHIAFYSSFQKGVLGIKIDLLQTMIDIKESGKTICGYGAPAKGNTLLNYCGIRNDFVEYTVDRNHHKQGCLTPGSSIPILAPEVIFQRKPDFVLILPWNLKSEIMEQLGGIRAWDGKFIIPIPKLEIV